MCLMYSFDTITLNTFNMTSYYHIVTQLQVLMLHLLYIWPCMLSTYCSTFALITCCGGADVYFNVCFLGRPKGAQFENSTACSMFL